MNNETPIPFDATVGTEITLTSTCELFLFWLPRPEEKQVKPEIGLDSAVKFNTRMRKEFGKTILAMNDRDGNRGGTWATNRYTVPPGTAIKVWGKKNAYGVPIGSAALILLFSKDAPVHRVSMALSGEPTAAKDKAEITGQFFVLNRDTVGDYPDVPPLLDKAKHYASPIFINEVFHIAELIPAPSKAMAQKVNHKTITDKPIAGEKASDGVIMLRTKKGRRVLG
jgi:hypothetical protein